MQQRRGIFVFHGKMPSSKNSLHFQLVSSPKHDSQLLVSLTLPWLIQATCLPQYMYKYVYINLHSLEVVEAGLILSSCLANRVKMILSERRCFNIHRVIKFRNLPQSSKKNKSTTSHHKYSKNENNVHKLVIQITVQKIAKPKWTFTSNFRYIQSFSCKVIHSRKRGLCKK